MAFVGDGGVEGSPCMMHGCKMLGSIVGTHCCFDLTLVVGEANCSQRVLAAIGVCLM